MAKKEIKNAKNMQVGDLAFRVIQIPVNKDAKFKKAAIVPVNIMDISLGDGRNRDESYRIVNKEFIVKINDNEPNVGNLIFDESKAADFWAKTNQEELKELIRVEKKLEKEKELLKKTQAIAEHWAEKGELKFEEKSNRTIIIDPSTGKAFIIDDEIIKEEIEFNTKEKE